MDSPRNWGMDKQNGICKIKHISWNKVLKLAPGRAWLKGIWSESHTGEISKIFFLNWIIWFL